jgi:hypothetical protein
MGGGITHVLTRNNTKKTTTQTTILSKGGGGKPKSNGKDQQAQKKSKKAFSNKSLKMGLFHIKMGTPAAKALPDKSRLKDGVGICLDFCSHKKKYNFPHQLCKKWQLSY